MREIKFRAWNKQAKVMRLVQSINYADDGFAKTISVRLVDGNTFFYVHGESCELMQYTGLTDRNGKEIYEGDVLGDETGDKHVIQYFQPDARYISVYADEYASGDWDDADEAIGLVWAECEIIGNIYEHPHLLEG